MSIEFVMRIIGAIALGIGGWYMGIALGDYAGGQRPLWGGVWAGVGALMGLIVTPFLTTRPIREFRSRMSKVAVRTILSGLIGLIMGLVIAGLMSFPISMLPEPFSQLLPFVAAVVFSYLGVTVAILRQSDIANLLGSRFPGISKEREDGMQDDRKILLDTSVIIDGRVADIARTGFIFDSMLVPSFVLNELQHIADSPDGLRRQRGRRGLDILDRLKKDPSISFSITDLDVEGMHPVDDKLIILARQMNYPILTNDYNLNRVAGLQGVEVLNINELANAVKAVFLPGEAFDVHIIQEGKEPGQGVGYLDDGTMVVVEGGKEFIESIVPVMVTKVLQTAAGRMIFARPANED
jgi:uncharacterized protein YacL